METCAMPAMRRRRTIGVRPIGLLAVVLFVIGLANINPSRGAGVIPKAGAAVTGIHKIQHVIVILQENRSFDSYFGTFPGADGIARSPDGVATACIPDPQAGSCQRPHVDHHNNNAGGPHSTGNAIYDIDGTKMDGFVRQAEGARCSDPTNELCGDWPLDVMGYHVQGDIPNYWKYAQQFVL